jgi:hypothetical protein
MNAFVVGVEMQVIIYNHALEIAEFQTLVLPKTAKILSVQMQAAVLCLWEMHSTVDGEVGQLSIQMVGTGLTAENPVGDYLGSVQEYGYVWHVFVQKLWESV